MIKITRKHIILLVVVWNTLIGFSAFLNLRQSTLAQQRTNLETARAFFEQIVTTRAWNALLGGVYAVVSPDVQPNPYLEIPNRDLKISDDLQLTLLNPAYMTRMIAELAQSNNRVQFHITSLNPIRPDNSPDTWETKALELFEKENLSEYYSWDKELNTFNYMAPLITEQSCLACHEKQGYQLGDIRGGIRVSFEYQEAAPVPIIASHSGIALVGSVLIVFFGIQLVTSFSRLEYQSQVDGLTGIHNRRFFDDYFKREHLRSRRNRSPLSIIIADIDFFKVYNDEYGHVAGDDCLRKIAKTTDMVLRRPGDIVARLGGEEFGIILPDTPLDGAIAIAELVRAKIELLKIPHRGNTISNHVTISLGVCTYSGGEQKVDDLLSHADKALYRAKQSGRNMIMPCI